MCDALRQLLIGLTNDERAALLVALATDRAARRHTNTEGDEMPRSKPTRRVAELLEKWGKPEHIERVRWLIDRLTGAELKWLEDHKELTPVQLKLYEPK